jgi:hypothetical protein
LGHKNVRIIQSSLDQVIVKPVEDPKDIVIQKLSEYLHDKPTELIKIICLLVKEENNSTDNISPTKLILTSLLHHPEVSA